MNNFKNTVASDLLSCISGLTADINLTKQDILDMFEYPPDSSLGDIAFPDILNILLNLTNYYLEIVIVHFSIKR